MNRENKLIKFLIELGGLVALIEAIVGLLFPRWFGIVGSIFGIIFSLITMRQERFQERKAAAFNFWDYFFSYYHP